MSTPATDAVAGVLRVAIVGAESTGKSELARALAHALAREFGLRCGIVDEYLRHWCVEHARTPRADEQRGIALEHARRIAIAATPPDVDVVLCDTTPLMVAVYSDLLFDDRSIEPVALACQREVFAALPVQLRHAGAAGHRRRVGGKLAGLELARLAAGARALVERVQAALELDPARLVAGFELARRHGVSAAP